MINDDDSKSYGWDWDTVVVDHETLGRQVRSGCVMMAGWLDA